jgi:hypothetical protein
MSLLGWTLETDMPLMSGAGRSMASSVPRRRLPDVLAEVNLLEVQLQIVQQEAGPHRLNGAGQRIVALHRRLDCLEHQLRIRALQVDENLSRLTIFQLRRRLGNVADRRRSATAPHYHGLEWRRAGRRERDAPLSRSKPNTLRDCGPCEIADPARWRSNS